MRAGGIRTRRDEKARHGTTGRTRKVVVLAGALVLWVALMLLRALEPTRSSFAALGRAADGAVVLRGESSRGVTEIARRGFVLFQFGDRSALDRYAPLIESVRKYARQHGYQHHVREIASYQKRVKPLLLSEMVDSLAPGDSLVFLDLDIEVMTPAVGLDEVLDRAGSSCAFVAQDSNHTINSGFLMLDSSPESKSLLSDWLAYFDLNGDQVIFDQFMLQEAVLRAAANREQISNVCYSPSVAFDVVNFCYADTMRALGLPLDHRTFGRFCFLDHRTRVNMHDSGDEYCIGDLLRHAKVHASFASLLFWHLVGKLAGRCP